MIKKETKLPFFPFLDFLPHLPDQQLRNGVRGPQHLSSSHWLPWKSSNEGNRNFHPDAISLLIQNRLIINRYVIYWVLLSQFHRPYKNLSSVTCLYWVTIPQASVIIFQWFSLRKILYSLICHCKFGQHTILEPWLTCNPSDKLIVNTRT